MAQNKMVKDVSHLKRILKRRYIDGLSKSSLMINNI